MKKIALLGSTGSIGQSTLSLCESYPDRFHPVALAAGANLDVAFAQCERWRPQLVSVATEDLAAQLTARLNANGITGIEVVYGTAGTVRVATLPEANFVVSAIVGVAGSKPPTRPSCRARRSASPTRSASSRRAT